LRALVSIGANIEDRSNNWKTPLNWASHWGHVDCVRYLVAVGANVSTFDTKGVTPLMAASQNGNVEIVQILLNNGANPLTRNIFNGTALSIAQVRNDTELVGILEPYYPPDPESSPYIIMLQIIKREFFQMLKVFTAEAERVCRTIEEYASFLWHQATVQLSRLQHAFQERKHKHKQPDSGVTTTTKTAMTVPAEQGDAQTRSGSCQSTGIEGDDADISACTQDELASSSSPSSTRNKQSRVKSFEHESDEF
jgi:hypothetical protein